VGGPQHRFSQQTLEAPSFSRSSAPGLHLSGDTLTSTAQFSPPLPWPFLTHPSSLWAMSLLHVCFMEKCSEETWGHPGEHPLAQALLLPPPKALSQSPCQTSLLLLKWCMWSVGPRLSEVRSLGDVGKAEGQMVQTALLDFPLKERANSK
jgi:hypothetical protein